MSSKVWKGGWTSEYESIQSKNTALLRLVEKFWRPGVIAVNRTPAVKYHQLTLVRKTHNNKNNNIQNIKHFNGCSELAIRNFSVYLPQVLIHFSNPD